MAILKTATLKEKTIKIKFPYDPDMVLKVKSLTGRQWDSYAREWSCPVNMPSVKKLAEWGFSFSEELQRWADGQGQEGKAKLDDLKTRIEAMNKAPLQIQGTKLENIGISIDFSLCPLYNGSWQNYLTKEEEYAKRSLSQNEKTTKSSREESSQREKSRSKKKGRCQIESKRFQSSMERKSFFSDKTSYASTRNSSKTSEWIESSPRTIWNKLARREWPNTNFNREISEQAILTMWLRKGISHPNKSCQTYISKCSNCIQSGLCSTQSENSNRAGRSLSQRPKSKKAGSEERSNFTSPWMDCNTLAALQSLIIIPGLQKGLYQYQLEDVLKIEYLQGKVLLGSQMGLGKTAQALSWLQLRTDVRPVVVICPASLKYNWERETNMWMDKPDIAILSGKNGKGLPKADLYIINYDILSGWVSELKRAGIKAVIADECHFAKNSKAQRTKALRDLCKGVAHILMLTGTPIVNRPVEMFNAINIVAPEQFPSFWKYAMQYCGGTHNGYGWDFTGATHTKELHELLTSTCMIRRLKEDVLKDLPAKTRAVVPMELDNLKQYRKAESDFIGWLKSQGENAKASSATNAEALATIEGLKQLTIQGKIDSCLEWVEDFIDQGEKLILFATHKATIDAVMAKFSEQAVKVDGSVSNEDRQKAVDRFQSDESIRIFVGNIKAAGVGLTLTAASNVAFLELGWTPGDHDQAEDRCHRIGQKDSVTAWYLVAKDSIEESICKLLDEKRKVLDQVLDGKDGEASSVFGELLESLKRG